MGRKNECFLLHVINNTSIENVSKHKNSADIFTKKSQKLFFTIKKSSSHPVIILRYYWQCYGLSILLHKMPQLNGT